MEIKNIMWHDVQVEHIKNKMPKDRLEFAQIIIDKYGISIIGYDKYNWSTGENHLYAKPHLVKLSSQECEFEAEWWGTKFKILKSGKTKIVNMPSHKVKITAKF